MLGMAFLLAVFVWFKIDFWDTKYFAAIKRNF